MTPKDILHILKRVRLFQVLPDSALQRLAQAALVQQFDADRTVFFQNDPADHVYLILSGLVGVEIVSEEGRTVSITSLESGDVFGEMAVLDNGVRSANIRTLQPTEMLLISQNLYSDMINQHPAFAMAIIRDLVRRLRDTDQQVEAITLQPLRSRLASLLLDLSRRDGRDIAITQNDLAERLSATREKVNVNLQTLRDLGAIEIARKRISVVNETLLLSVTRQ